MSTGVLRDKTSLCGSIQLDPHGIATGFLSKARGCTRENSNVSHVLEAIIICKCRFISCNKYSTLVGNFIIQSKDWDMINF